MPGDFKATTRRVALALRASLCVADEQAARAFQVGAREGPEKFFEAYVESDREFNRVLPGYLRGR